MSKTKLLFILAKERPAYYLNLSNYIAMAFMIYGAIVSLGIGVFGDWHTITKKDVVVISILIFIFAFSRAVDMVYKYHIVEDVKNGLFQERVKYEEK